MCARELAAVGELYARRAPEDDVDRENWAIDGHENVVAEVAAALGVSRGRARGRLRYAITLRERLPRVAELFARGLIDFRLMAAVVSRTELVEDPDLIAKLDAAIATHAPKWMRLSEPKLIERIDLWVMRLDPAGRRVPGQRTEDRYVEIGPTDSGLAGIWAQLHATDGAALDQKLDALAETVCPADPRNKQQRRADALGALTAGLSSMRCRCGSPNCSAAQRRPGTNVVIHVLAEQATISADSQAPGYLPGFGPQPSITLRDIAETAKIKPLMKPSVEPEPGYRPSAALAEFVRLRDLTCRFPGCDEPAEFCDIDHTVPFPQGPTHPSNLKLLCRYHHLLKTFYTGFGGWADRQLPDGTVVWAAPSGHTYTTTPGGSIFFPMLAASTGELTIASRTGPPNIGRGLMMPRRKRTRAAERHHRITAERRINEERFAQERLPALLARQPRAHPAQRLLDVARRPGKREPDERAAVLRIEIDTGGNRYPGIGQQL
jgi:Domain of unknown function (DUF222)